MTFKSSMFNEWAEVFWNPSYWLPKNTTWEDLIDTPDVTYPKYYEVCYPILFSVIIFLLRYLVERFVFIPIGIRKGLKANKKQMVSIPLIEEVLKKNSKDILNDHKQILGLAKQLDWSERQVERWIRRKKNQNRHSELDKFAECGWKVCYFSFTTVIGFVYVFNKPWFWKLSECWTNYPHQNVSLEIRMIYLIQLSFYWSLLVSQFFDAQRKDFWGMFIHHLATIYLLNIAYICNFTRMGILILLLHDSSDIFLEAAKCFKYIKWGWSLDLSFVLFVLVWIITRLVIFPRYILNHFLFELDKLFQVPLSLRLSSILLVLLFFLHIMWTYYIAKIIHGIVILGKKEDSRSSSSEMSDESKVQENCNNNT